MISMPAPQYYSLRNNLLQECTLMTCLHAVPNTSLLMSGDMNSSNGSMRLKILPEIRNPFDEKLIYL